MFQYFMVFYLKYHKNHKNVTTAWLSNGWEKALVWSFPFSLWIFNFFVLFSLYHVLSDVFLVLFFSSTASPGGVIFHAYVSFLHKFYIRSLLRGFWAGLSVKGRMLKFSILSREMLTATFSFNLWLFSFHLSFLFK